MTTRRGVDSWSSTQFEEALKKAGRKGDIIVYPDGPHGFHADYRPSYRKEMAEDGWKRLLAWFKENGAA